MACLDLADAMKASRHELGLEQKDAVLRARTGISLAQWSKLENAHEGNYRDSTYAAVDRALQWPQGRARELALGAEPATTATSATSGSVAGAVVDVEGLLRTVAALELRVAVLEGSKPPASPAAHRSERAKR